jgi:hypothetical protein
MPKLTKRKYLAVTISNFLCTKVQAFMGHQMTNANKKSVPRMLALDQ